MVVIMLKLSKNHFNPSCDGIFGLEWTITKTTVRFPLAFEYYMAEATLADFFGVRNSIHGPFENIALCKK